MSETQQTYLKSLACIISILFHCYIQQLSVLVALLCWSVTQACVFLHAIHINWPITAIFTPLWMTPHHSICTYSCKWHKNIIIVIHLNLVESNYLDSPVSHKTVSLRLHWWCHYSVLCFNKDKVNHDADFLMPEIQQPFIVIILII